MVPKIGIKLADGSFLPIMDETADTSEMLELTTVHDDQQYVQINLFKQDNELPEPHYIGSLIIEDIQPKKAGEPTLELHLMLDDAKQLSAKVIDVDSGATQTLQVSLGTFNENIFDDADFSLNIGNSLEQDTDDTSSVDSSFSDPAFDLDDSNYDDESRRKVPLWLIILLLLLGIGAFIIIGMLFMKKKPATEPVTNTERITTKKEAGTTPQKPNTETSNTQNAQANTANAPDSSAQSATPQTPTKETAIAQPSTSQAASKETATTQPSTAQKQDPQMPANQPSSTQMSTPQTTSKEPAHTEHTTPKTESSSNTMKKNPGTVERAQKELPPDTTVTEPPTPNKSMNNTMTDTTNAGGTPKTRSANTTNPNMPQAVRYKLRWGDTLWDISETYYQNPWLYKEIAEHNKLTNPDVVISGTYIEIPPK